MNDKYDVVVIGGGLAGLSAGAYICRDGYSLLVCEQADQTGGYFRTFNTAGFVFDAGLKAVENAGMLLPMLHQLKLDKQVKLHKSNSGMFLANRLLPFKSSSDIKNLYDVLEDCFPEQRDGLKALAQETAKVSQWVNVMVTFPNPLFEEPRHILGRLPSWLWHNLPGLINFRRTQALLEVPLTHFLSRYLSSPELIRILTQLYFAGTPALFGLGYEKIYLDYYYPQDGMQSLTDVLANYIIEKGGIIQTRAKVTKICVENGQATGVELEDGRIIKSKYVISAADMKRTNLDLLQDQVLPPDYLDRIKKAEIGESAICVFMGTDIPVEKLPLQGCSHLYIHPDLQGIEAADRLKEDFFSRTPIEMSIPCFNNPALAPAGQSGIIISALARSDFSRDWETQEGQSTPAYLALKEKVADQLIKIAQKVIPGLEEHILFRQIATPHTYARYTLNSGGSICGWTYDRAATFHRKGTTAIATAVLTPVRNLLQAGQWTFYPGGAPVCILSGRLAADYVGRHIPRKNKDHRQT